MQLTVQRMYPSALSTIGDLQVDGIHRGFTLEPPIQKPEIKPRAIPPGTYDLTIRWSPRFTRLMPHVENVPGFEGVLIHWGNYPKDTEGCLLVGKTAAADFVGTSREVFDELFQNLYAASVADGDVRRCGTITYLDPPPDKPEPAKEAA